MRSNQDHIAHAATVLGTMDIMRSIQFYKESLDFELTFSWESPPSYAVLKRGETSIHLAQRDDRSEMSRSIIYIFCNDIEALYEEYVNKGLNIKEALSPPTDYGMREFSMIDPSEHQLIFGSEG